MSARANAVAQMSPEERRELLELIYQLVMLGLGTPGVAWTAHLVGLGLGVGLGVVARMTVAGGSAAPVPTAAP